MDPLSGRINEEEMFDLIWTNRENGGAEDGEVDGSEFLNDHGPGMEPEHSRDNSQTSTECGDDDSQMSERPPPQSGKVY